MPARARLPLALRRALWAAASAAQPIGSGLTRTAHDDWLGRARSRPAARGRWTSSAPGKGGDVGGAAAPPAGSGGAAQGRAFPSREGGAAALPGARGCRRLGWAPLRTPARLCSEELLWGRDRPWLPVRAREAPEGAAGGKAAGGARGAPCRCPGRSAAAPQHRPVKVTACPRAGPGPRGARENWPGNPHRGILLCSLL